mgnify:CR=1 FL=1
MSDFCALKIICSWKIVHMELIYTRLIFGTYLLDLYAIIYLLHWFDLKLCSRKVVRAELIYARLICETYLLYLYARLICLTYMLDLMFADLVCACGNCMCWTDEREFNVRFKNINSRKIVCLAFLCAWHFNNMFLEKYVGGWISWCKTDMFSTDLRLN